MRRLINKRGANFFHLFLKYLLLIFLIVSCKGGSGGKFEGFDVSNPDTTVKPITVSISSVVPAVDPVNVSPSSSTTFGVTLLESDSSVNYTYLLDNTTTLQSGTNPYYTLSATGLTAGAHTLKVTASNSTSSDFHVFNIVVNTPVIIPSFSPTLTGATLSCGLSSQTISALYSEVDSSDTVSIKWYLNNSLVSYGNTTATVTNDPGNNVAMINFHPDCSQSGINFIRLDLYDGHETTSQTWTIYVTAPITVAISDSTPTTDPTILVGSNAVTFGVTLSTADPTANFQFVLDNAITLQNDHRAYYALSGSSLSTGTHTLKVTASNTNSSANKTFNIRKNAPPIAGSFSPSYSGTVVNCGTSPITLYADMTDPNGDSLTYTWLLDDAPSAYLVASNSSNRAQVTFTPNCAVAGSRVIKAVVNDGFESTTLTWSVNVVSPITVHITSFLPTTNPTILTNNQTATFAVALSSSDSNVTYSFTLKNLTTLATTTLQSGTVPFYNLVASGISAGLYELKATASNGSSSDEHTFTVRKNSPPQVPPSPLTYSPTLTGTVLNCGSSSQLFQSYIGDTDNDILAVNWYLDGVSAANLVSSSSQTVAQATYTPSCAEVGIKTIRVDVYDGYETTTKTWTVSVVNPAIATINAYTPTSDPIDVLSTGTQTFTISATGKAPLSYEWKLDGNVLTSYTSTYATITGASLTTGAHTLVAKVSDSDSNQSHTFNIIKNAPPSLSNVTPTNTSPKVNINTVISFGANFTDANSDTLTVTWKLNNSVVTAGNANASVTTGSGTSTLVFTPSAARIGSNVITLEVSDGKETTTQSWTLNVNYFSDICNNLGAGKACTLLGRPGRGSNINPTNDPTQVMLRPHFIAPYGNTSSYFISDNLFHVVWFYNNSASTVNILGQSIGPGILKAVVGVGVCGTGVSGTAWNDFPLCNPRGIAWDSTNQRLFIADESNSRIYMADSSGNVYTVMQNAIGNNATGNQDNTNALTGTWCVNPRGIEYDSTSKLLYVACAGSYTIKAIDTTNATYTNWTAKIISGGTTAGVLAQASTDGTNGYAGTNKFVTPTALRLDRTNNILYVTDSGHCKIKAIDLSGSTRTNYFYNALTLSANSTVTLLGNGISGTACATIAEGNYSAMRMSNGWNMLELKMSGSTLQGLFLSEWNSSTLAFINNTAGTITLGGASVPSYQMTRIWNTSGTSGYYMPCSTGAATTSCYLRNPGGMYVVGNKLYVADYSNYRVRSLDVSTANGAVTDELGFDQKANFAGNGGASSESVQFNQPLNIYFDQASEKLIISDFYNYRFRSLNLGTGRVDSFISNGAGDANNSQVDPTVVGTRGPRGIINYQNFYIYSDNQNSNCLLRAWNTLTSTQTILGVTTYANAIQTVVGNWANGCGAWNTSATTGTSSLARLNQPNGVTTDGSNIYFANMNAHCIVKVDSTGAMSTFSGLCGTSGTANGAGIAYNNTAVRYYYPTSVVVDPRAPYFTAGNLFVLDQSANATATKIRYINQYSSAVTVYGVTINPGEIKTIYTAPDAHGADIAVYDNQICYSTGGDFNYASNGSTTNSNHNVICLNRDDSTGTQFVRFGRNPSAYIAHGYIQEQSEEEGIPASSISLAGPSGLTFDSSGNLYIAERDSHVIRMVKKWW